MAVHLLDDDARLVSAALMRASLRLSETMPQSDANLHPCCRVAQSSHRSIRCVDLRICLALHPADQRHHDRRNIFRTSCRPAICATHIRRLRLNVSGRTLNLVAFVPPSVSWHVLPSFMFTMGKSIVMPSPKTLLLLDLLPSMRG